MLSGHIGSYRVLASLFAGVTQQFGSAHERETRKSRVRDGCYTTDSRPLALNTEANTSTDTFFFVLLSLQNVVVLFLACMHTGK